jgi:hypothetical protein
MLLSWVLYLFFCSVDAFLTNILNKWSPAAGGSVGPAAHHPRGVSVAYGYACWLSSAVMFPCLA